MGKQKEDHRYTQKTIRSIYYEYQLSASPM